MSEPRIIAAGGAMLVPEGNARLERYVLDATGEPRPRVCFLPTASGDDAGYVARFHETYGRFGVELGVLRFFRRTPGDLRDYLASFDVVHVGGGNTRSMLAVWREHGFEAVLREAWLGGTVLCGSSAGSICWFASGLTDSTAGPLAPMSALGFLTGSHCPHYDGEAERRPAYRAAVAAGRLVPGLACDDGAALDFVGEELSAVVSAKPAARAYRVDPGTTGTAVETPLEPCILK